MKQALPSKRAAKITTHDFIENLDKFTETETSVIIHPGLPYNHIELKREFFYKLKDTLQRKIIMAHTGIDELNAIDKFVIMILQDAY